VEQVIAAACLGTLLLVAPFIRYLVSAIGYRASSRGFVPAGGEELLRTDLSDINPCNVDDPSREAVYSQAAQVAWERLRDARGLTVAQCNSVIASALDDLGCTSQSADLMDRVSRRVLRRLSSRRRR
jgi:hypothetical protein